MSRRVTPSEIMRKRQQCHDLKAAGYSQRQIQLEINSTRDSVRQWLKRPRPTDADVETAAVNAVPLSLAESLRRRQHCHDMKLNGASCREIMSQIDISNSTVRDWLSRPRPTDDDITAAMVIAQSPATTRKVDATGQVKINSRFDPDLFSELRAESELQNAAMTKVISCAVRLYLDVMTRARNKCTEPVNVLGYRA